MRRLVAALTFLVLTAPLVPADEPTDEEKRAEAHRTVLRRLSRTGGAKTAELGLSDEAAALVDLFLDVKRNVAEIRARRAPSSTMFGGTPHPVVKVEGGRFVYRANFVRFVIDEASVPVEEVPGLIGALANDEKLAHAAIESDEAAKLGAWRWELVAVLCLRCDEALLSTEKTKKAWKKQRVETSRILVASLEGLPPRAAFQVLQAIGQVGGEEAARALIERIEKLPDDAPGFVPPMYAAAVCRMDCPAARAFAGKLLAGDDQNLRLAALGAIRGEQDEETWKILRGYFAPDSEAAEAIRTGAIRALEKIGTDRARKILEAAFAGAKTEGGKISAGISLLRLGSEEPLAWLEAKLEELSARMDARGRFWARSVEGALKRAKGEK